MDEPKLREQLAALHEELEGESQVGEGTERLLRDVLDDIGRLLDRPEPASAPPPGEPQSLVERLRSTTGHLEEDHPRVTRLIEQIVETLAAPFQ